MRSLNLFPLNPGLSPFARRVRALQGKKTSANASSKVKAASKEELSPTPTPAAAKPAMSTSSTSSTSSNGSNGTNITTVTSCSARLHLVLGRRNRQEEKELLHEMHAHSAVKHVCVYTDHPLLTRKPVSSRQQRSVLTQATVICQSMTSLQLDFSSEFATPGAAWQGVVLDCSQLATMLKNAPQLENLSMKDVSLTGNVQPLRNALLYHPSLLSVEFKWCNDNDATDDTDDTDDDAHTGPPILATLIQTLTQMEQLEELTLLLSHAHDGLPLPQLAAHSAIQRLTLGLEQRHANLQFSISREQRKEEQATLMQFLKDLKHNTNLKEVTLFSHHWKPETIEYVQDVVASKVSNLQLFHLTDYNYGSDDPHPLIDLASALQTNTKIKRFKLVSQKRIANDVDKKTRVAAIDIAFMQALQRNTTLQELSIVHAGIQISDANKIRISSSNNNNNNDATQARLMLPFFLMTNRLKARQQFLSQENTPAAWTEFLIQHKDNTQLIFYLMQENPNLLAFASSKNKNNQYMWRYYF